MKYCPFILLLFLVKTAPAQTFYKLDSTFHDGPYVFFEEGRMVARWLQGGELREDTLEAGELLELAPEVSESFDPCFLDPDAVFEPSKSSFRGVDKLVAISDIHGQYDLMARLLHTHGVIDEKGNWAFGEGHLVVVGDIFDRGGEVTDILWLVHKLENQAGFAGGRVHYLLGNHEIMNLKNDLRYVNKRYRNTTTMLRTPYPLLFGPDTYLGRWIRSKPTIISINDMVFVHAGLSETFLNLDLSFEEINTLVRDSIIDQPEEVIEASPRLSLLYGSKGPFWYRGYFDPTFTRARADDILVYLNKRHIIVGHTPFPVIQSVFKKRIIGVDSTIQSGLSGEVLYYERRKFYRASLDGERELIK
ncbi:MAG: metallophosphoesterase [Saprospiraceae bacterium]